jgi:UDP-N-acetylglucosamine acyltransferase
MATLISKLAEVDPRAEIDDEVYIGPFCVVGPEVRLGVGTRLENNVTLTGRVTIGRHNRFYAATVIGAEPQDLSYRGGKTEGIIGDETTFRESVTVNRATEKEDGVTHIGSHCYLMAGCHIAHDCKMGDRIIMANATLLGGHVHVHDNATLSGGVAVHHFSTIGSHSFVGAISRVQHDVPPFMLADGAPARPRCVNLVGLRRNGFSNQAISDLNEAFRLIYRDKAGLDHAREILRGRECLSPAVNHLLSFIESQHEGRHGRGRERRRAA